MRLGQQGGWPLTMFLSPDGKPMIGGTYWPPEPRYGRPSFRQVLQSIASAWRTQRNEMENRGPHPRRPFGETLRAKRGPRRLARRPHTRR